MNLDNRLSNALLGKDRQPLTVGQLRKLLVGLPPETMVALQTGERCGSIFTVEFQTRTPRQKPINPNNLDKGVYWSFEPEQKVRIPTDVLVMVSATSEDLNESEMPDFEKEKEDAVQSETAEQESDNRLRLL